MQNTQDTEGNTSGVRSFMVLMDKNKDTQWIEDGKFVDNPLPKPVEYSPATIQRLFGELTGLAYVKDVTSTILREGVTQYVVKGFKQSDDNWLHQVQRTVTVHL